MNFAQVPLLAMVGEFLERVTKKLLLLLDATDAGTLSGGDEDMVVVAVVLEGVADVKVLPVVPLSLSEVESEGADDVEAHLLSEAVLEGATDAEVLSDD